MKRKDVDEERNKNSKVPRLESENNGGDFPWDVYPGTLLKLSMRNFMCHEEFLYEPFKSVNFIVGQNGSGKSAVQHAIVFVMGGSGKDTNRGSSVKKLIKSGEYSSSVEIVLYNSGDGSYRPEIYGSKISITRTITQSSSTYKFKNSSGSIVEVKRAKDEVSRIASFFCIQIDNPVAILSQDKVKTFLQTCDPSLLYQFFMKATQLEACRDSYNKAQLEHGETVRISKEKKSYLKNLDEQLKSVKKQIHLHEELSRRKEKIREFKNELAWASVSVWEAKVEEIEADILDLQTSVDTLEDPSCSEADSLAEENHKKEELIKDIEAASKKLTKFENGEKKVLKNRIKKSESELRESKKYAIEAKSKLKYAESDLSTLQEALKKSGDEDIAEYNRQMKEKEEEIKQIENDTSDRKAKIASKEVHLKNFNADLQSHANEGKDLAEEIKKSRNEVVKLRKNLEEVKKRSDDVFSKYGHKFPDFMAALSRKKSDFKVPPIGPLGAHIKFKPKVSISSKRLAEYAIGGKTLRTFVVDNFEDHSKFQALKSRHKMSNEINVIVSSFRDSIYDVSKGKAATKYPTVYDVLEFQDPNVANALIDQKKIERTVLFPDEETAQTVLSNKSTVPKNFAQGLVHNDKLNKVAMYNVAPFRSYILAYGSTASLIQSSVQDHIKALELDIDNQINEVKQRESNYKDWEQSDSAEQTKREKSLTEKEIGKEQKGLRDNARAIERLRREMQTEAPIDVDALKDDLEKKEEELESLKSEVTRRSDLEKQAESKTIEARNDLREKESENDIILKKIEPFKIQVQTVEDKIKDLKKKLESRSSKKTKIKAELVKLKSKQSDAQEKVSLYLTKAQKRTTERIETSQDPRELTEKIKALENLVNVDESKYPPLEDVRTQFELLSNKYNSINELVDALTSVAELLSETLDQRFRGFRRIRSSICKNVKITFCHRLSARNFKGEMNFEHNEKKLSIHVDPQGKREGRRDLKTLSGGETSFSTVSLVLALWESMKPPFRILDEFDVFMDEMNRTVALDLILKFIKESRKYQYIFLTPLGMNSSILNDADVKVIHIQKA